MVDGKEVEGWFTLSERKSKDKVSGSIRVSFLYRSLDVSYVVFIPTLAARH
jgi:hypothetical protein